VRNNLAYFISLVFHPLLMPSYLFLFIVVFASSFMQPLKIESLYEILGIIFIVTFIIPVISMGTLRLTNIISDFHLAKKSQRPTPFFFIACFYGIAAYMFYAKLSINNLIVIVFVASTVLILLMTVISFFWKISLHGAAIGGVFGFILALGMFYPIMNFTLILAVLLVISGLVIYARLKLQAHTPLQVYAGAVLGFFICFWAIYYFL
jgi:membrane-associated phospholipid phosphatase